MKKNFYLIIFISVFSFISIRAVCIDNSTLTKDELIKKMISAYDPNSITIKANSSYTSGKILMPNQGVELKVESYFSSPNKLIIKTTSNDGNYDLIFYDGNDVWHKKFDSEVAKKITGAEKLSFIFGAYLESPNMKDWFDHFSKVILDNKLETVNKEECYVLKCTPEKKFEKIPPIIFYVNKRNFLIKKTITSTFFGDKEVPEQIYSLNYENIDGLNIARKTKTDVFGAEIEYNINEFKLNPVINSEAFMNKSL